MMAEKSAECLKVPKNTQKNEQGEYKKSEQPTSGQKNTLELLKQPLKAAARTTK
jgi:hypothetical protein